MIQRTIVALLLLFLATTSLADEIRPGYLELKENSQDVFSVIWKIPAKGNRALSLQARLPINCKNSTPPNTKSVNGAYIQRWLVVCNGGLVDKTLSISGLKSTSTDVLLRLEFIDGTSQSVLLTPTKETFRIPARPGSLQIVITYTWLGITHILLGVDHLLFVFALLLIVNGTRRLLWTITAFTLAHSLTLAGATLGFVNVPQQPVEAIIALSILFLAIEIVRGKQGRKGAAAHWPWLVAFIFGLLHGFGFAGALAEVGLPQQAIPLALVFFNVGVELGQVLFVVAVLSLGYFLHKLKHQKLLDWSETVTLYAIGGLSSFWVIERISTF